MRTSLLVIGAGPYGVSVAAWARAQGVDTTVVGRPMAFWRDHMPAGMFLRSGAEWHLDAGKVLTFAARLEQRGLAPADVDAIPIAAFLDYADWFIAQSGLPIVDDRVTRLARTALGFEAELASGALLHADRVVAATGIARFQRLPAWAATLPAGVAAHTCDLVDFTTIHGLRLLIVGGRQSAYEWAALAAEHGAARVDIVHRHPTPRFEKVSWSFADRYIDLTLSERGWWRRLPAERRQAIAHEFWAAGRLTLEPWLTPRLPRDLVHGWPETVVSEVTAATPRGVSVRLSSGESLEVDRVAFATGYEPRLGNLPYLSPIADEIAQVDGFPLLDDAFQSSVPGLYFTGFAATRDFGPFFGFTRGCTAAATLLVDRITGRTA